MKSIQITIKYRNKGEYRGVALLLTLVVLVVLSGIVYDIATRITMRKHRQQYIIDYQKARYACDSGLKYAYTVAQNINLVTKPRTEDYPDLLDFSDVFWMDKEQYEELQMQWYLRQQEQLMLEELEAMENGQPLPQSESPIGEMTGDNFDILKLFENMLEGDEYYDEYGQSDEYGQYDEYGEYGDDSDPNDVEIPGPYNVQWPYVIEPIEFEMGDAKVRITIEDENAKLPLIWATQTTGDKMEDRSEVALETLCSWMRMDDDSIDNLKEQILDVGTHKQFSLVYKPITVTEVVKPTTPVRTTSSRTSRRTYTAKPVTRTVKKQRDSAAQAADFAKLIHHSSLDLTALTRQVPEIEGREESPIKYLGLWGSTKVNVNTAPRHVIEAAFSFGGQAEEIAEEIIKLRREKPFEGIRDIEERMYGFSDSIKKATPYITCVSSYLTIKVTASRGKAVTTSIAAVQKSGNTFKKIAALSY